MGCERRDCKQGTWPWIKHLPVLSPVCRGRFTLSMEPKDRLCSSGHADSARSEEPRSDTLCGGFRCLTTKPSAAAACCAMPPPAHLRWLQGSKIYLGRRLQSLPTLFSSSPTISATPTFPATAVPDLEHAQYRSHGRKGRALSCKPTQIPPSATATRVALITGRYQYRLRVGLEEPLAGDFPDVGLPPEHPTLPSLLKKAGYGTTLIGKWHLGTLPKFGPLKSGYDHFYGFRGGALDYYSHNGTDHRDDLWDDDVPVDQTGYSDGSARQPGGGCGQWLREIGSAFPHQPPFQCAALALGSARRRSRVRAACAIRI